MKTIIAGSRSISLLSDIRRAVDSSGFKITEVVSGGARGADALGEMYANAKGIPVKLFPADWNKYGKSAGPVRNAQMAAYAEALIAVWDGESRGTKNMIEQAKLKGLAVYVHIV